MMDEVGPEGFVFGAEESHGYLAGTYARDKDGAVGAMLLCQLAARAKSEGKSLVEQLESLYWQYGYHAGGLHSITMPGSQGMARMNALLELLRTQPPAELGGLAVSSVRDYQQQLRLFPDGRREPFTGPEGNLLIFELAEEGNYFAVRPSGTEPKAKFYMFTYVPAEQLADLKLAADEMDARLDRMSADLQALADTV